MEKETNAKLRMDIASSKIILDVKKLLLTNPGTEERAHGLTEVAQDIGHLSLEINRIKHCDLNLSYERLEVVKMLHSNVISFIEQRKGDKPESDHYIEPRMAKELSNIVTTILTDVEKQDKKFVDAITEIHKHLRVIALEEYKKQLRKR